MNRIDECKTDIRVICRGRALIIMQNILMAIAWPCSRLTNFISMQKKPEHTKKTTSFSGVHAFFALLTGCLFLTTTLAGCAGSRDQEEPFMAQWWDLAEESRGYSHEVEEREAVDIDALHYDLEDIEPEPVRELPRDRVTLNMQQAPVPTIIRALSRIADQNIIVSDTVEGTANLNIREVPWDQAFESIIASQGLSYVWEGDIIRIKSMQDLQQELDRAGLEEEIGRRKLAAELTEPLMHRIVRLNYADPEKLQENLIRFLSRDADGEPRGDIVVDQETNSLMVQATRNDLERVQRAINHLDRPRPQILMEANIVEATRRTARELGVRWSGRYVTPLSFEDEVGFGDLLRDEAGYTGDMDLSVISARLPGSILYAHLQALEREGEINILTSPSITTMDNRMAFTEHGQRVPYETVDEDGDRTVEFENAVLRLEVLPSVMEGDHLKMDIKVNKDEVDFTRDVRGQPLITTKQTETNLVVRDGETIVISGLSKETVSDTERGVMGFKDMPGLGWLFKTRDQEQQMEEFLIFITPTILAPQRY